MRVAIIGCGQLARMLALAGIARGLEFSFLAMEGEECTPVQGLGPVVRFGEGRDLSRLYAELGEPQVMTVEREQLPLSLLRALDRLAPVHPSPDAVAICQHRRKEKSFLGGLGLPTAPWRLVDADTDLMALAGELGWPLFVKSCEQGYDGKNQWCLTEHSTATPPLPAGNAYIAEGVIRFDRELSLVAVRGRDGQMAYYPLTENRHHQGILHCSVAPAPALSPGLQGVAQEMATTLMTAMGYVGVLTLELFQVGNRLIINELAPRVHNSGHWTQDGSQTCQFDNHLRAITGAALGSTSTRGGGASAMINLLGMASPQSLPSANTRLHWYHKPVRPGRKQGHINLVGADRAQVEGEMTRLLKRLYPGIHRRLQQPVAP
ncbi:5-(carboxyamino)imidazole ribonucleotide synthase [Ferrimonas sediminicola]|uniref:N5-carboxyaminoimidazole ribonucleotide synthase n=1 Tax=Ferrimonas sediminicola TaxID=2569538 RepID=A0A4U1BCT8_9GAMM|nr:5-(carboxyamino)imidazole ribonucleotide synthase [Ferrimonas sediminicola]TKB48517.1 5-(carboxyamino)imidazole ribonucleotide synthase [Ferrimonas sediminicola]